MSDEQVDQEERDRILREMLFVPCETREHLHTWVKAYLGLDLPGSTVCHTDTDFEPSNSNPMDLLWEIYQAARSGDRERTKYLYYAARGCYKSVIASVVEALCFFHLRRDVGHMAANKDQSKMVQLYLRNYLQRPILREFRSSKNESEISVTWYERGEEKLTPAEYKDLKKEAPDTAKLYVEKSYTVKVVVATIDGVNGLHCSMMVMDELDLTPEEIISEAMMIPAPGKEHGEPAMVLMTSSRKFSFGPVQQAIDSAHKTGAHVRHWNVIDVTAACPPERHRPDLPRLKVFYSNDLLQTITAEEHSALPQEEGDKYKEDTAYAGCISNCRLFAMCRGRLATEQHSETRLLRHPADTQEVFVSQPDVEKAQAQLMCWKPSRSGMIYPRIGRDTHVRTARQIAEMITGDPYPSTFGKADLIRFLKEQEVHYFVGIDHGFNHCFAGVLGVKWGAYMFVIDAFEFPGLELDGKIRLMKSRYTSFDPDVYADTSHPGDNKSIARHGFRMRKWKKGPGSVVDGIGIVRMKLNPVLGKRPELYFLAGDPDVDVLFDRMCKYAWVIDTNTGEPTGEPNEKDDDGCDACRYMIMNAFAPHGKVSLPTPEERNPIAIPRDQQTPPTTLAQRWSQVADYVGIETPENVGAAGKSIKGRKGSFKWDMS